MVIPGDLGLGWRDNMKLCQSGMRDALLRQSRPLKRLPREAAWQPLPSGSVWPELNNTNSLQASQ